MFDIGFFELVVLSVVGLLVLGPLHPLLLQSAGVQHLLAGLPAMAMQPP